MITSDLLQNDDKLVKSNVSQIKNGFALQIGKTYIIFHTGIYDSYSYKEYKNPFEYTNNTYKVVKILSVTPKLDYDKISNSITFDDIGNDYRINLECKDINNNEIDYSFGNYLASHPFSFTSSNFVKYGYLYFEIEYMDVYSKSVYTKIAYNYGGADLCIEDTRQYPGETRYDKLSLPADRFFSSDIFDYDFKNKNDRTLSYEISTIEKLRYLLSHDLADYITKNFKMILAKYMTSNTDTIKKSDTINIDGVTWYNGFYTPAGTSGRRYLFYDYIPAGWRLPYISELTGMLKKYPLLTKQLKEVNDDDDDRGAVRNRVGMECIFKEYIKKDTLKIMTFDDNDYAKQDCYYPETIRCVNINNQVIRDTPSPGTYNNGRNDYVIMLVKMNKEEIKNQKQWISAVFDQYYTYRTIDDVYRKYGIDDLNHVVSIEFDIDKNNEIFHYARNKANDHLHDLKKAIAAYMGNDEIYSAANIKLEYNGENIAGTLHFDDKTDCDIKELLTKITPLLCKDLCIYNINSEKNLLSKNDTNIYNILYEYQKMGMHLNMYYYIKDALCRVGINPNYMPSKKLGTYFAYFQDYAVTAYISKMILHMDNGENIEIKGISPNIFRASSLYMNEINDIDKWDETVRNLYLKIENS
ncbi:MAG: hypothetical protein [Wendovervirus sonii]|uniref:Uncharacterized protein n=1 Tax=phage Lak_Megaphage_Sonny TaxID=3109229 RepID=A0ABZ0Z2Z8_9CAUD|nr:MAG: hypothetical protein [phage Lak_Megaphage_Sonny]